MRRGLNIKLHVDLLLNISSVFRSRETRYVIYIARYIMYYSTSARGMYE